MDVTEMLTRKGLPVTAQRLSVLRVVSANPHGTVDDIAQKVKNEIGAISKQAVYDSLSLFVTKGIVRKIEPAGSPTLYECRVGDNHHHLICRSCRKTVDVNCATGAAPCLNAENDHGFQIDEAEVIYWGTCPTCLRTGASAVQTPT